MAHIAMVFNCHGILVQLWLVTLMSIEKVALIFDSLLQVLLFILVKIYFRGVLRRKLLLHILTLRWNIGLLHLQLSNSLGQFSYYANYISNFPLLQNCYVTITMSYLQHQLLSPKLALSTSTSTIILLGSLLLNNFLVWRLFPLNYSQYIFSLKELLNYKIY